MTHIQLTALVGLMTIGGLAVFMLAGRASARVMAALGLLITLVGAFYLYIVIAPHAPDSGAASIGLFVGSAVLFRLLSSFEAHR